VSRNAFHRRTRRAFTLVEVLVATVVTAMVAGAVVGTINAVQVGLDDQDTSSAEIARLARAQARLADHLYRARMILAQRDDSICLWLPSEAFDGTSANATNYDTINADELRWYVVDRTARTLAVQRVTNTSNRTSYGLATDWHALRTSLAASSQLTTSVVLEGVLEGTFRRTSFNPCSDRRAVLDLQLDDEHGGIHFELGGIVEQLQKHSGCQ
jgi:prepilin-type N-terminal cleavage/methylation domain-containing protein